MRLSRLGLLFAVAVIPLVLWGFAARALGRLPAVARGVAGQQDRPEAQGDRAEEGPRARALDHGHRATASKIGALQGDITVLQRKQVRIQGDLDAKRAELARIQEELRQERIRLARLRARLAEARDRAGRPPRRALQGRQARRRDRRAERRRLRRHARPHRVHAARVRPGRAHHRPRPHGARRGEAAPPRTSACSRVRQTKIAAAIEARRDEVSRVRGQLVDRRDQFAAVRSDKATALASTRDSRKHLEGDLAALEAANAKSPGAARRRPERHRAGHRRARSAPAPAA